MTIATAAAFSMLAGTPAQAAKRDRGGLRVLAEGVPQGQSATITVAGKRFRKKVPKAGKLRNLRPGKYRVWATPILADGGTAAVPDLPIRIRVPKRKSTTLRLQYQWNPRTDVYPPGPATGLTVTGRSTSSVSLRWVNSQAPDLQGVAVRRKAGAAAPVALDDGKVVDVEPEAQSLVDEGLHQYTTYTYSVFMVDTAGNASTAASITVQTAGDAVQLTAGTDHTCALLPDDDRTVTEGTPVSGRVACWGANDHGQLGTGSRTGSDVPQVLDLEDVVQVSAGGDHTCALVLSGGVWCWGRNDQGELGTGSTQDATRPVQVSVPDSASIAAGGEHTCAVSLSGALRCWGADDAGQSGQRMGDALLTPPATPLLTGVTSIATGWAHTCAVRNGGLRCFGENGQGQLGNGGTTNTATPVAVSGLGRPVAGVTAGVEHTCAVLTDDSLACWGGNQYGQVGDGTTSDRQQPVVVLQGVTQAAAGAYHTCGSLDNTTLRCWGRNNSGRLGDGTETDRSAPTRVLISSGVSAVAAGGYHSCAVSGPSTYCWGANPFGQLGTGRPEGVLRPANVAGL